MLQILRLSRRSAALQLLETFQAKTTTWVVSDLRSKQDIQNFLLDRDGGYLDTSVLRASDFWKLLLRQTRPEIQIVSRDFIRSVVRAFLADNESVLGRKISSENAVMSSMDRFAGVVFHGRGDELMTEWFEANPEAKLRWGESFFLARLCLRMLVQEQKVIVREWAAALLQSELNFEKHWTRPLIVDLGCELTSAEAQLFLRLSKVTDVRLLKPDPAWGSEAENVLRPYQDVEGASTDHQSLTGKSTVPTQQTVGRMSGQLAEVKRAVSQSRRWLEAGVPAHEIAILAPDIEDYWPVLQAYLEEEGLPVDKAVAVKLNAIPAVNRWLARLRPRRGEVNSADLELSFYGSEAGPQLRHEEFRSLFSHLYGEEDLARHPLVQEVYDRGPRFAERMTRDEFLLSAVLLWDGRESIRPLTAIVREVFQNSKPGTILPIGEWVRYLEATAANRELTIKPADSGGILVTKLASARSARLRRRIFLGLTEEALRKSELNPIPLHDIARLSDLGFHMEHPDQSTLEFELRWLLESESEEDLLLMSVNTFEGSIRAPAALWLRLQKMTTVPAHPESYDPPGETRWDLLQQAAPDVWGRERNWANQQDVQLFQRLRQDLGDTKLSPIMTESSQKLSPSMVRSFLDCPFKVAATSLFRLKDLEEVDLDLARTGLGTLTHELFQTLTDRGLTEAANLSDEDIVALVEEIREKMQLVLAERAWWGPFLKRQIRIVREFLKVEADWQRQFPKLKLLPSEQSWTRFFDPQTGIFHDHKVEGGFEISGRIDRLETDGEGRFVVVDYKASGSGLADQANWLSSNDLQLLFYMWAVEKGALQSLQGTVIGAFYYIYKDFSRGRGFQIEEEAGRLFPPSSSKSKKQATVSDKEALFVALEERIVSVIQAMKSGAWAPHPRELKVCERCTWTKLCRAPHLN